MLERVRGAAVPRPTTWPCSTSTASSTSAVRRSRAPPSTWPRPGRPGCGWRSSPTTPRARPSDVADAPARARGRGGARRRGHLGPGGRAGAARPARRRGAAVVLLGGAGWTRRSRRRTWSRSRSATTRVALVSRLRPRRARGATIMRAAVRIRDGLPWVASNTDLTHPDDLRRRRRATACWSACCGEFSGRASRSWRASRSGRCSTRRSAGWAAAAADGGRPAGHRHRGRASTPDCDSPAGDDRRDRAGRAGGGAARRSGRRTSRRTWAGCSSRTRPRR